MKLGIFACIINFLIDIQLAVSLFQAKSILVKVLLGFAIAVNAFAIVISIESIICISAIKKKLQLK